MELLHPGVYIQEVPSGVRPIEGVSTSTAAFIGKTQMGPLDKAVLITSFLPEFDNSFGTFLPDSHLVHAVFQFFNNGGKKCYIVRVAGAGARAAEITIRDRKTAAGATLVIRAASPGEWGNSLDVTVTDSLVDADNEFTLSVFRDRSTLTPPLPPLLLETHQNLSMTPGASNFVEKVVAGNSKFIRATADVANLGTAGAGTSRSNRLAVGNGAELLRLVAGLPNGATETPGAVGPPPTAGRSRSGDNPSINPPADRRKLNINLNSDGPQEITLPSEASTGAAIAASIQAAVRALTANDPARQPAYAGFTATFQTPAAPAAPFYELTSGTTGPSSSVVVTNATVLLGIGATLLGLGASHGGTETAGTAGPPATAGVSRSADNPSTNPPADSRRINVNLDTDGAREVTISPAATTGAAIAAEIQAAVRALTANTAANQPAYTNFTATFETPAAPAQPFYRLTSGSTGVASRVVVTDAVAPAAGISLLAGAKRFAIEVNRDGPHVVQLTAALADGAAIATAIRDAVRAITPNRASNAPAFATFNCTYENGAGPGNPSLLMTSGTPGVESLVRASNSPSDNVAGLLRLGVTNGGSETSGSAILRPAISQTPTEYHLGDAVIAGNVAGALAGSDGMPPGDAEHKNGLRALDVVRDVNIVAIPGVSSADVVSTGVNYCTQRTDCFFIGDVNATDDSVEDARAFIDSLTVKSSYGAVYYPWLRMADPTGRSPQPVLVPPSGFVAGMYARIDSRRGVFKAPAGTEANVGGAVGLAADTTDTQQDFLNPIGLNVIRTFPASGMVIWGARTLATRSDPEYRYIPVRRLAIFLEQSIYNGIQFAVFEPNDEPLWSSLRLNIGAFMFLQFRAGAFQGKSANDAFFVKCDAMTTTQQDIDAGRVNILVGFAPLKPAEFVVLQLTQKAGQPAA
jgi:phage tail sheath protein FI